MHESNAPQYTICTASSFPVRLRRYVALADEMSADGLDVDTRRRLGRVLHMPSGDLLSPTASIPINSIWLTESALPDFVDEYKNRFSAADSGRNWTGRLRIVMCLNESLGMADLSTRLARAQRSVQSLPGGGRLAIAVETIAPDGGRTHLHRLQLLRMLVEEWDAGFALDLTARADARWEAEAAVQIVGRRLEIIRVHTSMLDRGTSYFDVHRRTLRACADLGFAGTISLAPTTPWWLSWHGATVRADLTANYEVVSRMLTERRSLLREQNRMSFH